MEDMPTFRQFPIPVGNRYGANQRGSGSARIMLGQ